MKRHIRLGDRNEDKTFVQRAREVASMAEAEKAAAKAKKLWLIEQEENTGYDTYDSAVVVAASAEMAKLIHPSAYVGANADWSRDGPWASSPANVKATYLGICTSTEYEPGDVVCSSFNAG
ncbi:hypothetical protein EVC24_161 [Rhizobium phage RHph_I4]|nr:hypothetical protein EVC24_161 [Rhizobium phage RHph_I4]